MLRRIGLIIISIGLWGILTISTPIGVGAQSPFSDLLSMRISAGYDTLYRPDHWLPIRIELDNRGDTIRGSLVVRPATSGRGIEHTYSTPIELNTGGQALFLYITARDLANNVRVELIDEDGRTLISADSRLTSLLTRDTLLIVVSGVIDSRFDISNIHPTGYKHHQIRWRIPNIPDRPEGLSGVNMLIFNDVNTDQLSIAQRQAIRTWVIQGGHLLIMGGDSWQATASGLTELLPFSPTNSITTSDASDLLIYAGDHQTILNTEYKRAEGIVREGSTVLAGTTEAPAIIRKTLGNGTIDYVVANLEAPPFVTWDGLSNIFLGLFASAQTPLGWSYGFSDWANAQAAVQILPGVDLLPTVISLVTFLGAYILLIGPINYIVLRLINRRGLAWFTIPIFIIIFTILAWSVGIELRGTDARLNRLTIVQAWDDVSEAHIEQLIGLLAPRRGNYTLTMDDNRSLRPLLTPPDVFNLTTPQTNIHIRQSNQFAAVDVPVDASFISAFHARGTIEKPDIRGNATWFYRNGSPLLRGSIRNNSNIPLRDAMILARGTVQSIGDIQAGALATFETESPVVVRETAMPASIEFARTDESQSYFATDMLARTSMTRVLLNARDVLGDAAFDAQSRQPFFIQDEKERQIYNQKRALIASFMVDQYGSRARGNRVFLLAWSDVSPTTEDMGAQTYSAIDTTLYIIELATEITPTDQEIVINKDQFTWIALPESQIGNISPANLNTSLLDNNIVAFRFTPIEGARLAQVTGLTILVERTSTSLSNALELWDWQAGEWVAFQLGGQIRYEIIDFERFIGAHNAVQIRTTTGVRGGSRYIQQLGIEQRGRMS